MERKKLIFLCWSIIFLFGIFPLAPCLVGQVGIPNPRKAPSGVPPPPPPPPPPPAGWSEEEPEEQFVDIITYWELGEVLDYSVTRKKAVITDEQIVWEDSVIYKVWLEVLDSTESSYTIRWRNEEESLKFLNVPIGLAEYYPRVPPREVIYKTSHLGELQEILNWEELSKDLRDGFRQAIQQYAREKGLSSRELESALEPFITSQTSEEGLRHFLFPEIAVLHYFLGKRIDLKKKAELYDDQPNPYGEGLVYGDGEVYVESYNADFGMAVIDMEASTHPLSLKNSFFGYSDRATWEIFTGIPPNILGGPDEVYMNRFEYLNAGVIAYSGLTLFSKLTKVIQILPFRQSRKQWLIEQVNVEFVFPEDE